MSYSRRSFLKTLVVTAGSVSVLGLVGCNSSDENTQPNSSSPVYFPHGVASGDPKENSVMLWSRLNGSLLEEESTTVGLVVWKEGQDPNVNPVVSIDGLEVSANNDFCVRVKLDGLDAYTHYYYQFVYVDHANVTHHSLQGRTKTALPANSTEKVKFAFASCQDFIGRYYNSYLPLLENHDDTDFILFLGDFIYETTGDPSFQGSTDDRFIEFTDKDNAITINQGTEKEYQAAQSLDNYREIYKTYRTDSVLLEVLAKFPLINIWDDHEFTDDAWQFYSTYDERGQLDGNGTGEKAKDRCVNAMQAFLEYVPVDDSEWSQADPQLNSIDYSKELIAGSRGDTKNGIAPYHSRIHRSFEFGNTLKLVATDYRSFRPDHPIAEDTFPGHMMASQEELEVVMAFDLTNPNSKEERNFVKHCEPYCTFEELESGSTAYLIPEIHNAVVAQYQNAGFSASESETKAVETLSSGYLSVSYLNSLISYPIDDSAFSHRLGISFKTMGKSSILTSFGTRYASSPKWYELYSLCRSVRCTGSISKKYGQPLPSSETTLDIKGLDNIGTQDWQNAWGEDQESWVKNELTTQTHTWRFVANSVSNTAMIVDIGSELTDLDNFIAKYGADPEQWPNGITEKELNALRAIQSALVLVLPSLLGDDKLLISVDQWDGFPLTRRRLQDELYKNAQNNTILLAGDIHSSWVTEHSNTAGKLFEFTGPSICSASASGLIEGIITDFEDTLDMDLSELTGLITKMLDPVLVPDNPGITDAGTGAYSFSKEISTMIGQDKIGNFSNIKYKNTSEHGITIIEASHERVITNYFSYSPSVVDQSFYHDRAGFIENHITHRTFEISGDAANRTLEQI